MPNYKHMLQILLTSGETVFAMTVTDTDEMPMAFSSFVSAMHRPAEAGGVWRAAIPEFGARRNEVELDRWIHTLNLPAQIGRMYARLDEDSIIPTTSEGDREHTKMLLGIRDAVTRRGFSASRTSACDPGSP